MKLRLVLSLFLTLPILLKASDRFVSDSHGRAGREVKLVQNGSLTSQPDATDLVKASKRDSRVVPAAPEQWVQVYENALPSVNIKTSDFQRFTQKLVLEPERESGNVARIAARALEKYHFSRTRFRDEISSRFFDRYMHVLDPQRMYFFESDYQEFLPYRDKLDDLTMGYGDVRPAYEIFNRYLERIDQQYSMVMDRLSNGAFEFASDDVYRLDRKELPRPKNLTEASGLWDNRLRFEYLAERLTLPEVSKVAEEVWKALSMTAADLSDEKDNVSDSSGESASSNVESSFKESNSLRDTVLAKLELLVGKDQAETLMGRYFDNKTASEMDVATYLALELPSKYDVDIREKLTRRYQRILRNVKQYESHEVLQVYIDSLAHAYDPHSNYFGKSELDSFSISMNLSLTGIGATLQSEDGYTVIRSLVAGAPAERSKQLNVGDKIVAVSQGDKGEWVDVVDEKLPKVVDQIRGTKGSLVRLLVIPDGADPAARKEVALTRDEVKLEDSEAKAQLVEFDNVEGRRVRLGVIDLPSFYASFPVGVGGLTSFKKSTTGDVAKLLQKLMDEGAEGIVLDLRRNGGGSLEEAINLTGLFIKTGPVVQKKLFNGRVEEERDDNPLVLYGGPLLVLTSRFSASASEIVAGALQDYGRALIVGDKSTHGKGTVQTIQELGMVVPNFPVHPGAIKVTVQKFYRASGASTQLKGVVPDMILPSLNNHAEVGEASLENALPWDEIPSARFEPINLIGPHLAT
jgi:carboxyl-terminal processing protease